MGFFSAIKQALGGSESAATNTALHDAARSGHVAEIERLLNAGAAVDLEDQRKRTPLSYAAEGGFLETVKLLLDRGAKASGGPYHTPLTMSLENGHEAIVRLLAERGLDLSLPNETYGWTPLHVYAKKAAAVRLLLSLGANPSVRDKEGETPFLSALGETEAVVLFLDHGADLEEKNKEGDTLLHLAAAKGLTETVRLLLNRGAKVDARNNKGETPLHAAIFSSQPEIAAILLDAGAEIDAVSENNTTALWRAVLLAGLSDDDKTAGIKLLLERGADGSIKDKDGNTALMIATKVSPNAQAAALLRSHDVSE